MNKTTACLNAASLQRFIEQKRAGKTDADTLRHVERCRRCSLLVAAAKDYDEKAMLAEHARVEKLFQQAKPKTVEPGQIWRLEKQPDQSRPLGIITRGPEMSIDLGDPDVRFVRARLDYLHNQIDENEDVFVHADESPLRVRYLLETWNERPIPTSMLESYVGKLAPSAWQRLESALTSTSPAKPLPRAVAAFRERCVQESADLSRMVMHKLARILGDEEKASQKKPTRMVQTTTAEAGNASSLPWIFRLSGMTEELFSSDNEVLPLAAADQTHDQAFETWVNVTMKKIRSDASCPVVVRRAAVDTMCFKAKKTVKQSLRLELRSERNRLLKTFMMIAGEIRIRVDEVKDWSKVAAVKVVHDEDE
ncbi:MAG TPA: hypothetical protein PKO06_03190 [Candidatus Ozemobacteraceae bacterium]|nr:hypothetical protein [Candidatus Ozemobacteraceae bacterium]